MLDIILNIISQYKLTGEELLLIYLTFIAQSENGDIKNHSIYFKKWYENGGHERLKDLFESLKEKNVIIKNYNPDIYDPNEIEFNKRFINQYFKLTGQLGQELWDAYPAYLYKGENRYDLRNFTKRFKDLSELYFWYASTIGHSREKHQEILEILDWAKKNDLVNISIVEFIGSCRWNEWKKLRQTGVQGKASTFDIYETV